MKVETIFLSIGARDFEALSLWWKRLLGRGWDEEPMPGCREWTLTGDVLLQVLDRPHEAGEAVVSLRIAGLDGELARLREDGNSVPEPTKVEGFETLRFREFADPEGNRVGLLEGF